MGLKSRSISCSCRNPELTPREGLVQSTWLCCNLIAGLLGA
jgi:hypothetical protein